MWTFYFINNSKVYVIHQTARDFLLSSEQEWSLEQSDTESLLSNICINYLLLDNMDGSPYRSTEDNPCFMEHAAEYWPDHVWMMSSPAESKAETRIDQIYDVNGTRFGLWFPMFWRAVMRYRNEMEMSSIRLAAFNGHKNVLRRLIPGSRKW